MCRLSWNLGASTSWNPQGQPRRVMGLLYLLSFYLIFRCLRYNNIQRDSKRWTQFHKSIFRLELLPLHRQPICSNWWFQRQMLSLIGGWILKRRRNARCTAVADSVLMNSRKQKILCCIVAILLSTDAAARLCARRALWRRYLKI